MKNLLYISVFIIFSVLASCQLDDNISPNYPSADELTARQKLAAAQVRSYGVQGGTMNNFGNVFMNSWSGNIYYFGNPMTKAANLQIDNSFYQSIWNSTYLNVAQLQDIVEQASDLPYHKAIAKILKAHYMQYVVDLYNDVPYSEAFKKSGNINPKYDKALDVYKALVGELNEALELISNNEENSSIEVKSEEDVIMGGDMDLWHKFANSVKLRYLVRMSKTTNADAISFRDQQLQTLQGADFIDADVTINPGYNASSGSSMNPIYSSVGLRLASGSLNTYGWRLYKASKHIADALNPYDDIRRYGLFRLYGGGDNQLVSGIEQGSSKDESKSEWGFASIGGWLMSKASEGGSHDGYLMLHSEMEYLLAEAAVEFPSYFSDAEEHFYAGIQASYEFYDFGQYASYYMSNIAGTPGVDWNGTTDKIECIQFQRWISLTNIHAVESYLGYIKTGYPVTPLAVTAQRSRKPYRLIYPQTEYSTNAANVPNMTADQAFEINEFTPFWIK